MKHPLLRYQWLLDNYPPLAVNAKVSTALILQARSDEEAFEAAKNDVMRSALLKAAAGLHHKVNWDVSHRHDGTYLYSEFYVLTREQLGELLDRAYLLGHEDNLIPRE